MAYPSPASAPSRALTLTATNLRWLGVDDATDWDQCAHGTATCAIGSIAVTALDCNLTAASLFLLRTLEHDHTAVASVAPSNRLFPCCGHSPWVVTGERFPTVNLGCDAGEEVWVHHTGGIVELAWGDFAERMRIAQWHEAVVTFADQVRVFYDTSPPRRRSRGATTMRWRTTAGMPSGQNG